MSELLGRAVRILDVLGRADGDLSIRELADRAGLPKSSVQRVLSGLVETDLVMRHPATQAYRLGPRALALGMAYLRRTDLRTVALPHLNRLRDHTGETVGLSVVVGREMYHIEQVESAADLRRTFAIGRPHPLWAGAPARLLLGGFPDDEVRRVLAERAASGVVPVSPPAADRMLAEVRRARTLGYASAFEETIAGVHTLAAAIRPTVADQSSGHDAPAEGAPGGEAGRAVARATTEPSTDPARPTPVPATIAVTGPSVRFTAEAMDACLPELQRAAARIAAELGGALG